MSIELDSFFRILVNRISQFRILFIYRRFSQDFLPESGKRNLRPAPTIYGIPILLTRSRSSVPFRASYRA